MNTKEKSKKPYLIAVSGIKNSGKTTLITKLIPKLCEKGYKVATIKHDGHDFQPDKQGSDTDKHLKSGAQAVAIFSENKYMIINKHKTDEKMLIEHFSDFDIILLEGFKYSDYPKIEIVRKENSKSCVCDADTVIALVTDVEEISFSGEIIDLDDIEKLVEIILKNRG